MPGTTWVGYITSQDPVKVKIPVSSFPPHLYVRIRLVSLIHSTMFPKAHQAPGTVLHCGMTAVNKTKFLVFPYLDSNVGRPQITGPK